MQTDLENGPAAFSMSRSGMFTLVYRGINLADTARYLSTVDLRNGTISEFMAAQGSNFLQSRPWEGLVTDDGKLAYRSGLSRTSFNLYSMVDGVWMSDEITGSDFSPIFSSQKKSRILRVARTGSSYSVHMLTTRLDTLACFDSGRRACEPVLVNSGEAVVFSSDNSISVYRRADGIIDNSLLEYTSAQPSVISLSDSCWACAFKHNSDLTLWRSTYVMSGSLSNPEQHEILLDTDRDIRVLSVSDSGDVLCVIALNDSRFYLAYRYALIESTQAGLYGPRR